MSAQTLVSIYTVNESGDTADRLGTGSLLDPRLVLAHPAAAGRLAVNPSTRVRVGIAAAWWAGGVEVIDVKTVQFADQPYVDLVALELARQATSPVETLDTGETVDEFAQTLRKHLHLAAASADPGETLTRRPGDDDNGGGPPPQVGKAPWCPLFDLFCGD